MHKMEELRDMLCEELEEVTRKGELSAGSLDVVDKLTHSIKSIDTILAMQGNGYSSARGRRRDSMGRYSRTPYMYDDKYSMLVSELHELMESAPDEKTRMEFKKFIHKMEEM